MGRSRNVVYINYNDKLSHQDLIRLSAVTPVQISGWGMTEENKFMEEGTATEFIESMKDLKIGTVRFKRVHFRNNSNLLVIDPSSQTGPNRVWPCNGDSGGKL